MTEPSAQQKTPRERLWDAIYAFSTRCGELPNASVPEWEACQKAMTELENYAVRRARKPVDMSEVTEAMRGRQF